MSEVLHANIFFLITGIAVVVCSVLLCIILFHLIKVARAVRRIVESIEAGAEVIVEDIQNLRTLFSDEGFIGRFFSMLAGRTRRGQGRRTARSEKKKDTYDSNDDI
jgi:hypothetical protein